MARIYVSQELGEAIRSLRTQVGMTGKELSERLGKSPAYITRLEKADIATVSEEDLIEIFNHLSDGDESKNEMIEKIFNNLKIKYSHEEIKKQVWFQNFDTVTRQIPIPGDLIDNINERIINLNIEPTYLLNRINANEALTLEEQNDDHPFNKWWSNDNKPSYAKSIKIQLDRELFFGILEKTIDVTSYIFILSIVFYLIKYEHFGDQVFITDDENNQVMDEANNLLSKYKFYSLNSREEVLATAKTRADFDNYLTSFEKNNMEIMNVILGGIRYYSDKNIKLANQQLELYAKNLKWDLGFMMKLVSLNFCLLDNVSHTCKSNLLSQIQELIDETNKLPKNQKDLETY